MFDRSWFFKYQSILLFLLNTPGFSFWFRRVLCIDGESSSVGNRKIGVILPSAIFWLHDDQKHVIGEFRTHNKFSKRIYYSFLPIWKLFHWFDMNIANVFAPSWNLGFDSTGDLFPAEGAASPMDGYVQRNIGAVGGNTFSDIRDGAGTGAAVNTGADVCGGLYSGTDTDRYRRIQRGVYGFDTSAIGDSDTIDAATFSLSPAFKNNSLGDDSIHCCAHTPASSSTLANGDYANFGSTSFGSIAYAAWTADGGYDDISLNSSGLSNINKTGYSFFGSRAGWDMTNSNGAVWASAVNTRFEVIFADLTGTSRDPKLVVTYTPAGGGGSTIIPLRMLMGIGL